MQIALITSTKDTASANLKKRLLESYEFVETELEFDNNPVYCYLSGKNDVKLYTIETPLITRDDLDDEIEADLFLFLSRHRAEGGRASLTVHPIGNFGEALAGGKSRKLGICHSEYFKNILNEFAENVKGTKYEATVESTHHGPFMNKPALFVELGSNETFWEDKEGAKIVIKSVMDAIENDSKDKDDNPIGKESNNKNNKGKNIIKNDFQSNKNNTQSDKKTNPKNNSENNGSNKNHEKTDDYGNKAAFVIGGSHYSHIANKLLLESGYSVSHICPKHKLADLDDETLRQAMERSFPKADLALLDWKGLGSEKQRIIGLLEKNGIEFERSDKFFK